MQKNFFIAFFERSGSTMLVDLLNQHPHVKCRMEIFDTKNIEVNNKGRQVRQLDKNEARKVLTFFKKERLFSKTKLKGFKFKYPNQIDQYLDVYTYLLENQFKCIFLLRKNMLKAAISHQYHRTIRKKTGLSNIKQTLDLELQGLGTLDAINYMEARERQNNRFQQKLYADFKQIKTVYYEDLLYNKQETLDGIFQFLSIKSYQVKPSNFKKIVDDDLRKAIQNYDWVHKLLSLTPYINYFYKDEIDSEDLKATKNKLIKYYENLDIKLTPVNHKNNYHHQLQEPLNLTDKEVYIFRKLSQYYIEKFKWLNNKKNEDSNANYKQKMFKKIKQLEIKLFLGEEKYQRKFEFDKTFSSIKKTAHRS